MQTNAVANAQAAASTSVGGQRLAESFDTFLVLLTTQMKNQDPLSPMDSGDFTQQIVQMTGVEQQLLTNQLLKQLVGASGDGVADAVSLIGKQVRAATNEANLSDKSADWVFRLDREAQNVKVEVLDSKGGIVHVQAMENLQGGEHKFSWNGKNVLGAQLADGGAYTLRVTATDSAGATVGHNTFIEGLVRAVEQVDGQTFVTIGGSRALWQTISSIGLPPTTTTNSGGSNTPSNDSDDETPAQAA
ncbi:MAG: flagellar hook capping FlgD N-terminal domain-containing protein [Phenylobacterium sp.]|uniref:flagellar hook assembly protein FlgD n=1 Tax=Phenylobacterium sp. TaxID=1871053 RepID=UPI002720FE3E|nr:flagellar hook capping FlgD N-terminal domain-containing protein [Phenylobacterium sp.]MDO8900849.1 flagellar hook capping FlgD N-terminal domain-containing protein [Phenylobacterium sp.]MDP2212921.1 flagellar hook capping FlgD N-terminal domain-containing protein [Phenylobacterium sp.]